MATGAISQEHGLGGEMDGGVAIAFLGDLILIDEKGWAPAGVGGAVTNGPNEGRAVATGLG